MPRPLKFARPEQMNLFPEAPASPTWHQLPTEVRTRTRDLLARLLCLHLLARPDVARDGEGRDE